MGAAPCARCVPGCRAGARGDGRRDGGRRWCRERDAGELSGRPGGGCGQAGRPRGGESPDHDHAGRDPRHDACGTGRGCRSPAGRHHQAWRPPRSQRRVDSGRHGRRGGREARVPGLGRRRGRGVGGDDCDHDGCSCRQPAQGARRGPRGGGRTRARHRRRLCAGRHRGLRPADLAAAARVSLARPARARLRTAKAGAHAARMDQRGRGRSRGRRALHAAAQAARDAAGPAAVLPVGGLRAAAVPVHAAAGRDAPATTCSRPWEGSASRCSRPSRACCSWC